LEKTEQQDRFMPHTILILDDDPDILFFCTYVFENMGFQVVAYDNCNDILAKVESARPDLVLMDNWIPDIGGVKATQEIKASKYGDIPVILFSANSNLKNLAEEAGADTYLKKPFDLNELENLARKYIKKA
jgi:DNA-binding response OmpR family regulator